MDSIRVRSYSQELMRDQHFFIYSLWNRDLGILDENGYGAIVGRIKDMIIRGGENVYPREIEEILHTHPGIQDVHVNYTNAIFFFLNF